MAELWKATGIFTSLKPSFASRIWLAISLHCCGDFGEKTAVLFSELP